jgi:hypothetical protein
MKTSKDECWDAIGLQAEKDRIWKEAIERFLEIYRHSGTSQEVERRIRNLKMGDGEPKRGDGGVTISTLPSRLRCLSDDFALACEHASAMDEQLQAADALAKALSSDRLLAGYLSEEVVDALDTYEKIRGGK